MKKTILLVSASFFIANCNQSDEPQKEKDASTYFEEAKALSSSSNSPETASKAAQLYKKSCELGLAEGCTAYGMHYYADTERDPEKDDLYYFKKGCEGGDEAACTLLKMAPQALNREPN